MPCFSLNKDFGSVTYHHTLVLHILLNKFGPSFALEKANSLSKPKYRVFGWSENLMTQTRLQKFHVDAKQGVFCLISEGHRCGYSCVLNKCFNRAFKLVEKMQVLLFNQLLCEILVRTCSMTSFN